LHSEAQILFWTGKNRDGWFTAEHLLDQVAKAINIFEGLTKGYVQGLFLFDNAPSHQKCADGAITARNMVKGALFCHSSNCYSDSPRLFSSKEGVDKQQLWHAHA
jgi:hypothetical protein